MSYSLEQPSYAERVYAGVLGKIVGVYLGRPIEQWSHERIEREVGEVDRYLHVERGVPLVVADDDISGTFTFLRALADHDDDPDLTPAQIGETWLNYIVENRTILWWGGIGVSTEHTAYLRLKAGVSAPASGSIALNGRTVAEQIGAQIFIEGWGLIHPGDPSGAADFARRAGSVSHDGEAVHGAVVVAALVAQAFVEDDVECLLDVALAQIPASSTVARMIADIRGWYGSGLDWRTAFGKLRPLYGYDRYGGGCHVVPNHGVVILALLYGAGDFSHSLMIANTCGWDTDCNSANVGCIVGVMKGLSGIDAAGDWRGPVADRLFLPTADGGRCVSDAVQETEAIVRTAFALQGLPYEAPKDGARFSFAYPGSLQGFQGEGASVTHADGGLRIVLEGSEGTATTATFPSAEERRDGGYAMACSPTLSPGQTIRARVVGGSEPVAVALRVESLEEDDSHRAVVSEARVLEPGETADLEFRVPSLDGYPTTRVGLSLKGAPGDAVTLERLDWDGAPDVTLTQTGREAWKQAWVNAVDEFNPPFDVIQNEGDGMLIHGCREWEELSVEATLTVHLAESAGVAVRVQGLRRYYALRISRDGKAQIVKRHGETKVLAEKPFAWAFGDVVRFRLSAKGNRLVGTLNDAETLEFEDYDSLLRSGAIALVVSEGRIATDAVKVGSA